MVTFSMTFTDANPVFKVTAYLKSNISTDKVTIIAHYETTPNI